MKLRKLLLLPIALLVLAGCSTNNYALATTENYANRALSDSYGFAELNSVGEQKILVVPVVFTNTEHLASAKNMDIIERLFFGESDETGWESVASYYHKSSYGKLTLTGGVQPFFYSSHSTSSFAALEISETQQIGENNYWDQTHYLIEDIYNTLPAELFQEYDQDGDGHVDALWIVYMASMFAAGGEDNDPFWAYKFYWNRLPNFDKPTPSAYAWASIDFAVEGVGYSWEKLDAHTFIHETGHLFGLVDYYDYLNLTSPAGQIDMMDHNVADHNIYSKYLLNWVTPYVVSGNATIKLRPAESSGDFILLKNGWNGHAYDEYILIEYYTPTGLNAKDSSGQGYRMSMGGLALKAPDIAGVRMWHVDSRLIELSANDDGDLETYEWIDEIRKETEISFTAIGPSNSGNRRYIEEEFKLLHLMDADGNTGKNGNWFQSVVNATNNSLFQKGATIKASEWGTYLQTPLVDDKRSPLFNDGTPVGYTVTIKEMTNEAVTIQIRKA